MEMWSTEPPRLEFKITVGKWLLHSSKDDYLFSPSDKGSRTPLLVHLNPRDEDGLESEEEGASETQQGARGWCYIWYYGYDKRCTTTYQGHYGVGCGSAKNDTGKTKFSGAYYSTEGQWNSSTCDCDSAKISAYLSQGQVQRQRQGEDL